ncbi:MAG: hypothetical protein ABSC64_10390 [Candidatus Korobacteraceae bacterium]
MFIVRYVARKSEELAEITLQKGNHEDFVVCRGVLDFGSERLVAVSGLAPTFRPGRFGLPPGRDAVYGWLGVADPEKFKEAKASGIHLPSNHSPFFAPDMEPSLKTAIESEVAVLRNLMARSNNAGAGLH